MLESTLVELRAISDADTDNILRWRNAPDVKSNFLFREELTAETHRQWLERQVKTGRVIQYIIVDKQNQKDVGSVYLRDIDQVNNKAEFGIFIGDAAERGRGLGAEAARLIVDEGFSRHRLHKIFLRVLSANTAAIASYRRAGFAADGCFRDDVFLDGRYQDVIFMSILNV